ncbi:MAG: deoxyguanosinetriphosphate triphosphohydrolase [Deltaproteobacteria bacterium]|nr:MAG: deoxyguanosinetriphosphate triphosphohydrolase [Deltaproteobacteria bacterium]
MLIRESLEEMERKTFSPHAQLSSTTKGRAKGERECDLRPPFQRDRDRIIHSKAFRRLKHKTQVFLSPTGDHYRTRLTHTLEVSQIARTISRGLRFNEDLTEAIALGHDLGHTPFGHAGEEVLNQISPDGFSHPEQSLRVVDRLERDGRGLNLTYEVRDGIVEHSKGKGEIIPQHPSEKTSTLEGQVVRAADVIAYVNHDLDDAIRAGVIREDDIPDECSRTLGKTHGERIDTMVKDVLYTTLSTLDQRISLSMSHRVIETVLKLRDFLYERVYDSEVVHGDFVKASKILIELYEKFTGDVDFFLREIGRDELYDTIDKCVCDYLAGMTDRYAFHLYERMFLPRPWSIL